LRPRPGAAETVVVKVEQIIDFPMEHLEGVGVAFPERKRTAPGPGNQFVFHVISTSFIRLL
jgi:hypothetical protein